MNTTTLGGKSEGNSTSFGPFFHEPIKAIVQTTGRDKLYDGEDKLRSCDYVLLIARAFLGVGLFAIFLAKCFFELIQEKLGSKTTKSCLSIPKHVGA